MTIFTEEDGQRLRQLFALRLKGGGGFISGLTTAESNELDGLVDRWQQRYNEEAEEALRQERRRSSKQKLLEILKANLGTMQSYQDVIRATHEKTISPKPIATYRLDESIKRTQQAIAEAEEDERVDEGVCVPEATPDREIIWEPYIANILESAGWELGPSPHFQWIRTPYEVIVNQTFHLKFTPAGELLSFVYLKEGIQEVESAPGE